MCFGGSKSSAPTPLPSPSPGVLDTSKVVGDPSQAAAYRGAAVGPNDTGRTGGTLLLDASTNQPKATLGGN